MTYVMIAVCILLGAAAVWLSAVCTDPRPLRRAGFTFTVLGTVGVLCTIVTAAVFLTRDSVAAEERVLFSLLLWPSAAILMLCIGASLCAIFAGKRAISPFAAAVPVVWTFPLLLLSQVCASLSEYGGAMTALGCFLSLIPFLCPGAALLRGAMLYEMPEVLAAHRREMLARQEKQTRRKELREQKKRLARSGKNNRA